MVYVDIVIDYFASHAKDEAFRLFCQNLQPTDKEWLRVAAAYSITGRESEIAAIDDLKRYNNYRESCKEHLEQFLKKYYPF